MNLNKKKKEKKSTNQFYAKTTPASSTRDMKASTVHTLKRRSLPNAIKSTKG